MTTPESSLAPERYFKESVPIELWSATIQTHVPYEEFEALVRAVAQEDEQAYTGFITRDSENRVTSFTRTRYPRRKYTILSIEECEIGTAKLARALKSTALIDVRHDDVRVVLGLVEGYGAQNPTHTVEEVQAALPAAVITEAEVFAAHPDGRMYTEPAAIVYAPRHALRGIYELADTFKQERFAVENFGTGLAYMVETRYCSAPDADIQPVTYEDLVQ